MLILRSEMNGTRVVAIDELAGHGARGRNGRPARFIDDPAQAEAILHASTSDRGRLLRDFFGGGILFSDGEHWRKRRRIIQPAFAPRDVDHHLADVTAAVPHLVGRFETAARLDRPLAINDEALRFTMRVLYQGVFGVPFSDDDDDAIAMVMDYFDAVGGMLAATIFQSQRFDGSSMARIRTAEAAMDAEIDRLVEARSGLGVDATDPRLDALGRIISGIDDETGVRDEARALMLAGAETTSNALGFLLLLLARHPDVRNRLEEEIDDRTRDDAPFLEAVILETLRLFPTVWFQTREMTIGCELGGLQFEKDDLAFVTTALIHRHPDLWPDPDAFRPDRFLGGDDGPWRPPHRYAFLPFGGGRHLCLGQHLAMHEIRLTTKAIIERFRVDVYESAPAPAAEIGIVLKPARDLRFKISERLGRDR
ncbi:MAG: cytochrome P450 [Phycisphaeraceae bacterium]|nr:cytochrome P450 [Phycisphaeraceae bacterium]